MKLDDAEDLQDTLDQLQKDVDFLMSKRIRQVDIVPDSVKQRAMGESNRWVRGGLEADLPVMGEPTSNGFAAYFATDTNKLWIWNGTAWVSVTLT